MIDNKELKINKITMQIEGQCYCRLGKDFYKYNGTIEMIPGDEIPNYNDITAKQNEIENSNFIIEELINEWYNFICKKYNPKKCLIKVNAKSEVHIPVSLEKGDIDE